MKVSKKTKSSLVEYFDQFFFMNVLNNFDDFCPIEPYHFFVSI